MRTNPAMEPMELRDAMSAMYGFAAYQIGNRESLTQADLARDADAAIKPIEIDISGLSYDAALTANHNAKNNANWARFFGEQKTRLEVINLTSRRPDAKKTAKPVEELRHDA